MTRRSVIRQRSAQLVLALMCFLLPLLLLPVAKAEQAGVMCRRTLLTIGSIGHLASGGRDAAILYAASIGRGLAVSRDNGRSWQTANDGLPTGPFGEIPIRSLVADASDPLVAYIGVDVPPNSGAIYRTINGGRSWTLLASGLVDGRIDALAVAENSDMVYAVIDRFVFVGIKGGSAWAQQGVLPMSPVRAISVTPGNPTQVYAVSAGQLLSSGDGARTWSNVAPGLADLELTTIAIASSSGLLYVATLSHLLSSNNAGKDWMPLPDLQITSAIRTIVWDRDDPNVGFLATDNSIYNTVTAGYTWREMNTGLEPGIVYDIVQGQRGELFVGTSAGVWQCRVHLPPPPTATSTATATPTTTPTATATTTPTPSATATQLPSPTATASPTATFTATTTVTSTPTRTATRQPVLPTATQTATPKQEPTITPTSPPQPPFIPPTATPRPPTATPVPPAPTNTPKR